MCNKHKVQLSCKIPLNIHELVFKLLILNNRFDKLYFTIVLVHKPELLETLIDGVLGNPQFY